MITEQVYDAIPGAFQIQDAALVNVIVLKVCRNNKSFDVVLTAPGNMEAKYSDFEGKVVFRDAFAGDITTDAGREKVYVKYRT